MVDKVSEGIRIGPTVQQGGVGTIQQSIYLNHNNPCGLNFTLGNVKQQNTGLTPLEMISLLNFIIIQPSTQEVRKKLVAAATKYEADKTEQNFLAFLKEAVLYAKACAAILPELPEIEGYNYVFSLYDTSGAMFWDSHTPDLIIYKEDAMGLLSYQKLDLLNCPFGSSVSFFQLYQRPYFLPYIRISGGTTDELGKQFLRSNFLSSSVIDAENILSISSVLIDNQNTRVYNKQNFGVGSRLIQVMDPNDPNLENTQRRQGFYVNFHSRILINTDNPKTISQFGFIFLRLGLESVPK